MKPSIFTVVFSTVVGITLLSGGTALWLAAQSNPSDAQKRILDTTTNTWLMGTGAIFGLLGGRTANSPDREQHSDSEE
jgi:hypothetical protein